VGQRRAQRLKGALIVGIQAKDVELDEIWGFCFKKNRALRPGDDPNLVTVGV
jgi:hypothetical protein